MAQQTIVTFVDDLDGSEADGTVTFALDGRGYAIDLNESNAAKLRELLAPYIEAGRRQSRNGAAPAARAAGKPRADRERTQAIREWARGQGIDIADRGRIPATVVAAYNAGH